MRSPTGQWCLFALLGGLLLGSADSARGADEAPAAQHELQHTVRPLLERYCFACHSGERTEGDVDLSASRTLDDVRRQTKVWLRVDEMLRSGQMPPPDAPQPADPERTRLQRWVRDFLTAEARAHAGDPGPVVLRRLSNAEYTYTLRDLTGVTSLDPAREFPVDGAAGEGFTNTGSALVMSPALVTKYLDAAKEVATHAVLLPDGLRFSRHTSRRDWTNELLDQIRTFYRRYTDGGTWTRTYLHGVPIEPNQGGRIPLERYLAATLTERRALLDGKKSIDDVAREQGLNARYLDTLWQRLTSDAPPSVLLEQLRQRWQTATPDDATALAKEIGAWQDVLCKFNPVGHIGRVDGPKSWMEPVSPLRARQEFRVKFPVEQLNDDLVVYLTAKNLQDGDAPAVVLWDEPRLELQGHAPLPLHDIRRLTRQIEATLATELPRTSQYLAALAELHASSASVKEIAAEYKLDAVLLGRWNDVVGFRRRTPPEITGHMRDKQERVQGYAAVNGWSADGMPNLLTNRSDAPIQFLTLTVPARGVTVHPAPTRDVVVNWRSPIQGRVRIRGRVADADAQCGNGAAWRVELRTAVARTVLASGAYDNGGTQRFDPEGEHELQPGDVVSLIINARNDQHICDTTHVELLISEVGSNGRTWDLAADVVDSILEANPLPDSYGHTGTWHFCVADKAAAQTAPKEIPPGSALARWRDAVIDDRPADEITRLARSVQSALTAADAATLPDADRSLRQSLTDWYGPLNWSSPTAATLPSAEPADPTAYGIDPAEFGRHPAGGRIGAKDLAVIAPSLIEVRLPGQLAAGAEFVVTGLLDPVAAANGSVQLQVSTTRPDIERIVPGPLVAVDGSPAERRLKAALDEFRNLFPAAACYSKIVPVDEVVTLTLFHREDEPLQRLMLDESESAELDRLWDELLYVNQEPLALAVAFEQLAEFATQDRPDLVKELAPSRGPIQARADAFRQRLLETEPMHLAAVLDFADRAWRRSLTDDEQQGLRDLYRQLRSNDIDHEDAIRLTLARVLTSPQFLYRLEEAPPGTEPAPVASWELANRLSYFLWSSLPDDELRLVAESGALTNDDVLISQTRRMLDDDRVRRLAIEFGCQWLHIRDFDQNDEKNEALYPEFATLRGPMYEEAVRFFEDLFRNDRSVLNLLDSDHAILNEALARHYGLDGVSGDEWRRVEGVRTHGRGGILGMAAVLAKQSGASRTSPILRGNWVSETLLGEQLPKPPPNVPQLPETVPSGLTERQLIERHSSVAECAKCHKRIDPYGFALEQYDAIGRLRPEPMDTRSQLLDGVEIDGLAGLRHYLLTARRQDFLHQFCRKLLGYALGRATQLSDEPLLTEMQQRLEANDYRIGVAIEAIVTSPQFRQIRGRDDRKDEG